MLEIDDHHRLVRHEGLAGDFWCVQERYRQHSSYKREIWKPVASLLSRDQAVDWLTTSKAPQLAIHRFKEVSGRIQ